MTPYAKYNKTMKRGWLDGNFRNTEPAGEQPVLSNKDYLR